MIPNTIREAVEQLYNGIPEEDRAKVSGPESSSHHFGGGMVMRNGWGLWQEETPLKKDAVRTYGIAHADDISGLIMEWLWHRLRGEDFDPVAYCERFHVHWRKDGMTSLRAGAYNEDGTPMSVEQRRHAFERLD